jgi:hypothetical protein
MKVRLTPLLRLRFLKFISSLFNYLLFVILAIEISFVTKIALILLQNIIACQ